MSIPDPGTPGWLGCGLGVLSLAVSAFLLWSHLRASGRSTPQYLALREALDTYRADYAQQLAMLSRNLESLEAGMKSPDEALRDGRLNLSARVQALQLLRAGMAPDTAAARLGVASRDMRLLGKISRLLAVR